MLFSRSGSAICESVPLLFSAVFLNFATLSLFLSFPFPHFLPSSSDQGLLPVGSFRTDIFSTSIIKDFREIFCSVVVGNGAQCITQTQSRTCTMRFAHAHRPVVALTVALAPGDAASSVRFFFFFSFSSLTKWDWISVPCAIVVLLTRSCSIVARRFFQMMCHGERSLFLLCFE